MSPSTPSTMSELAAISSSVSASVSRWFSTTFSDQGSRSTSSSSNASPAFSTRSIQSDMSSVPTPATFRPRAPNMAPCPPELYSMFPTIQVDLIEAVYLETGGEVDATVPRLLELSDPEFAQRPRSPSPPLPPTLPPRQRTTEQSRDFLAAHYAAFTPGVAMSGMMRSDMPTSSLGPIAVQTLWDDANAEPQDDQRELPFLPDLDFDVTQVAAKTKTLLRDVATKLERFGSKVADEIEIALGEAPPPPATTSSRNSFALSMNDDDDASIVSLASVNPHAHFGLSSNKSGHDAPVTFNSTRPSSPAPRTTHFAARAGASPTGLTITTTRHSSPSSNHRRTNSVSSITSSIHSSAPPSPFVISEAGDSDDELDLDLDAATPSAASSSSVSRSPPRASSSSSSASSPTGPSRMGSWPIPAARRLGSTSSISAQRPSSPLAGSVLSTSPVEHVEGSQFKAKGKAKAEAAILIEE